MKHSLASLLLITSALIVSPLARAADTAPSESPSAPHAMKMDHAGHHAGGKGMDMKEMTPEMRKKMAAEHQKMADCLNSPKTMSECHDEMVKECPMMNVMMYGMMNGMMDGHKMNGHHMKGHHGDKEKACAAGAMCSEDKEE